ncbi:hypothetical protein BBJ29_000526 [Phytophthora kernoviae]|uniref:Uncharacterized protein n=1 Tax=Phytophthora kernoviae TaxID=325452 RepID=A0A3F2RZX7_9STRA|nr:hypothetical protein BBJ29_000526 [Phytophthora kernoviae]RLN66657.1 hypothetical protein BBP00_00002080 [Phytophthora kernoviae]
MGLISKRESEAAGDAKFLMDDAAADEYQVNGEADDAMTGVWGDLETLGGGGEAQEATAVWWDLILKQDPGLQADPVEKKPRSESDLGPVELLLEEQTAEDQANEHIRLCYQQMRLMEETGKPFMPHYDLSEGDAGGGFPCSPCSSGSSSSSTRSSAGECPFPPSATFGWEVRNETTPAGDFYVSFSKSFAGITPQEAMVGSWTRYAKPKSTPFRRHLRFEVLQVVNDSTYINGLDIEHPVEHDKVMRMIFLNFRMQTEKGFVIGRHSVNPTSPEVRSMAEQDSSFEYVDSSNWVEFIAVKDEKTGEPGCRVKFIARTEYNTQEDMYVRLVNAISRTMLWELAVVPSSLSLLPS